MEELAKLVSIPGTVRSDELGLCVLCCVQILPNEFTLVLHVEWSLIEDTKAVNTLVQRALEWFLERCLQLLHIEL